MEVKGVRNSCDMEEKKSDFILSTVFSLSHIELKAAVSSNISGGEVIFRSLLKIPLEISFVFSIKAVRGLVMLLVMSKEVEMANTIAMIDIRMANFRAEAPASLNIFVLL
jgi:hypothetical protein